MGHGRASTRRVHLLLDVALLARATLRVIVGSIVADRVRGLAAAGLKSFGLAVSR